MNPDLQHRLKVCVLQEREALGDAAPPKLVPKTLDSMREYDETTIPGEGDKAPTEEDAEVRNWHLVAETTFEWRLGSFEIVQNM